MSHILEELRSNQYITAAIAARAFGGEAIEPEFITPNHPLEGRELHSHRLLVNAIKDLKRHTTKADLIDTHHLIFRGPSDDLHPTASANKPFQTLTQELDNLKRCTDQIPTFDAIILAELKVATILRINRLRDQLDRKRLDAWASRRAGAEEARGRGYHVVPTGA